MTEHSEEDYVGLRRLHESTNEAVIKLQQENAELRGKITEIVEVNQNVSRALEIAKNTMQDAIANYNKKEQGYIARIQELQAKLRAAGIED